MQLIYLFIYYNDIKNVEYFGPTLHCIALNIPATSSPNWCLILPKNKIGRSALGSKEAWKWQNLRKQNCLS